MRAGRGVLPEKTKLTYELFFVNLETMENNFINPVRKAEQLKSPDFNKEIPQKHSDYLSAEVSFSKTSAEGLSNGVKIINEIYKLLDFFPDSDPLKNKAKEKALAVLENLTLISDAKGWVSLKKEKAAAQLLDDLEILESYLKLGKYQGWIDNINFLILTKECNNVKSRIIPPKGTIKKNLEVISNMEKDSTVIVDKKPVLITMQNITGGEIPVAEQTKDYSERQGKILQMLSEKEKVQVADIIKEIPNITKRTIRRDLDDLLKKRRIVRIGEWNQVFYTIK